MMNKSGYYSAPAIDALIKLRREGRIKWRAFGLGVALASFFNDSTGKAWPTRGTLSETIGIDERNISRASRELEQAGFMATEERGGHSTMYRLMTPGYSDAPGCFDTLGYSDAPPLANLAPTPGYSDAPPLANLAPTPGYSDTHNYNEQQLNRENNYNAELVGGTAKATGSDKTNDTFKTASKAASNKINLSQDAPKVKATGCTKTNDAPNKTASTASTAATNKIETIGSNKIETIGSNKIDLLDTQEEKPSGALFLLGPALSPTPSPSPFPDSVVLGWVDRFPHVDVPMAIERALSWHSEKGKTLTERSMSNWLHRVRPGAPEYIDLEERERELEEREREDAKWIRLVEREYENDRAMQAHYWWRYKNERDGRIPDGVECRKMSDEEMRDRKRREKEEMEMEMNRHDGKHW